MGVRTNTKSTKCCFLRWKKSPIGAFSKFGKNELVHYFKTFLPSHTFSPYNFFIVPYRSYYLQQSFTFELYLFKCNRTKIFPIYDGNVYPLSMCILLS